MGNLSYDSETFVQREIFCWNSLVIKEDENYVHRKGLGHAVAGDGTKHDPRSRELQYGDAKNAPGLVREQSESTLIRLKILVGELTDLVGPDGLVLYWIRFLGDLYLDL